MSEGQGGSDSIGRMFVRLIEDTKRFLRAEAEVVRVKLLGRIVEARTPVVLGAGAFLLGQSAMVALLVGLIFALSPALGPLWATLVVVAGALAVAGLFLWVAIGKLKTIDRSGAQ